MITTARTNVSTRTETRSTLHSSRLLSEYKASDRSTVKTITRNTGERSELSENIILGFCFISAFLIAKIIFNE